MFPVKKLSEFATIPSRGSAYAAGYDLHSASPLPIVVPSHGKALINTDLAMIIPPNHYGRVAPRSGLTHKHFIDVGAGVIDQDYRGNVGVILFNHGPTDFIVNLGDRIAQLILEQISNPEIVEVDSLEDSCRSEGGFGSTGI